MEGDGPSGGTARNTGLILASKSPYNVDVALCSVINAKPEDVPTVSNAIKRGLSVDNINKLELLGDEISCITDYKMPNVKGTDFIEHMPKIFQKPLKPIFDTFLTSKPVIRKRHCIGCGKCAESCPAHTIDITDKKAIINYDECIKCFCCHEMCPVKAIDIKRFRFFNM